MARARRRSGWLVLALMLLGSAIGASAAFASGDCCAGRVAGHRAADDPGAPCQSLAPSACCETGATGAPPAPPSAPAFAAPTAALAPARDRLELSLRSALPARTGSSPLGIVLRL